MNRWTQYDEDEYRLPEGMVRVGYDADTQRYTFQRGNQLWLGQPGVHDGGQMTRVGFVDDASGETEAQGRVTANDGARRSDGYQPLNQPVVSNRYVNRAFYPFILIICLFLVLVWKFVNSGNTTPDQHKLHCPDGDSAPTYHVKPGDSCWEIATTHGSTLDALLNQTLNPTLDCDHLKPGDIVCLPLHSPVGADN